MRLEASADQNETVGLEELSEVDVGQRPRVRRIPSPLEAIEVERGQRIDRGDLVVDEDTPARCRDPRELGDRRLWMRNVMQRAPRAGEIERARVEREVRRVTFDERDVLGRPFTGPLEELGDDVHAHDLTDERRQRECKRARTGPAVDRTLVSGRRDEGADLFAHGFDLLSGVIRDALGGRAEARAHVVDVRLRHRSPSCERGEARSRSRR